MIESLESQLSRFSETLPEDREQALTRGIETAVFAASIGDISAARSVVLIAGLLVRASLLKGVVDLPIEGKVENVIRLALGAISLSPEAALAAADRRSEEARNLEESVQWSGTPTMQSELPEDDEIFRLVEIEEMLVALRPLSDLTVDPDLRLQVGIWFNLEERFRLGDAASGEVLRRWKERRGE
ncbi:hypothetical protein ACFV84_04430 [Kitasatospora sp. NPDC059811]|uniref:hypothetical protein n=1 Tax=Streptomycetaceae TaxID=2062 RepID=UPI0007AFAD99|nr:hypothetical protein [Streptomyces sp. MJM8645]